MVLSFVCARVLVLIVLLVVRVRSVSFFVGRLFIMSVSVLLSGKQAPNSRAVYVPKSQMPGGFISISTKIEVGLRADHLARCQGSL